MYCTEWYLPRVSGPYLQLGALAISPSLTWSAVPSETSLPLLADPLTVFQSLLQTGTPY